MNMDSGEDYLRSWFLGWDPKKGGFVTFWPNNSTSSSYNSAMLCDTGLI